MNKPVKLILPNGLRVIAAENRQTPYITVNTLYDIGSRDEDPARTGFAHLFEHLMFGGSVNIPHYDIEAEKAGASNNAFTTYDFTNYYITVPAANLDTALWLESDRMLQLIFSEERLDVQRKVVCEEYKQRYLNQPYGDAFMLLMSLCYTVHPYRWPVIGKELSHIETATLDDVRSFFFRYYAPNNAIVVLSGNADVQTLTSKAGEWFSSVPSREIALRNIPPEPLQNKRRELTVERPVPANSIYIAYKMSKRKNKAFYSANLISDMLTRGNSSRLYRSLVSEKKIFNDIHSFVTATIDNGLLVISGQLPDGISFAAAEEAVNEQLNLLVSQGTEERELKKVINQNETELLQLLTNNTEYAVNLAFYELLGDAAMLFTEADRYRSVTAGEIKSTAQELFQSSVCSVLNYKKIIESK